MHRNKPNITYLYHISLAMKISAIIMYDVWKITQFCMFLLVFANFLVSNSGHVYCKHMEEQCLKLNKKKLLVLMHWFLNYKHKLEEKSTKSSRSSSKVVGLRLADLWEFLTLWKNILEEIP